MKRRIGATERLYPMPAVLVVGGTDSEASALTVAWIGVASGTPPTLAMAIRNTRHTLELMNRTGTFTVNVPSTSQAAQVDYCGITSGVGRDKLAEAGLTLVSSALVEAPIIAECPYNMECRIAHELEIGDYVLVLGEVVEVHADEEILAEDGSVDVAALDPLIYIAGAREYRALGEHVARAYAIGKTVRNAEEEA